MLPVAITGFGSYLPKRMLDNASLPPLDAPVGEEEIRRIGVYRRGWADESEGIAEMAAAAAKRALERASLDPAALDLVILANWTERRYIPEHAPKLLQLLGARRAFGWDVCCACAGFLYGLGMAHGFLQNPRFSRALVVASEHTSRRARPGSKGTLILADAAGAFVLEKKDHETGRLVDYELATDGDHHHIMSISDEGWVKTHIEQRELNQLAGESMFAVAGRLLDRNGLTTKDIAYVIPHSGTAGVQAVVGRRFGLPPEKILTNYGSVGNVSSASIPTAVDTFVQSGRVRPGDLILSMAVGTGWYAAAALYSV
jgi:3-oxoacyl-[acyl-carrier-protein] synthase-3